MLRQPIAQLSEGIIRYYAKASFGIVRNGAKTAFAYLVVIQLSMAPGKREYENLE